LLAVVLLVMSVRPFDAPAGASDWVLMVVLPVTLMVMAALDHRTLVQLFERARSAAANGTH
jgi:hypothetical protein